MGLLEALRVLRPEERSLELVHRLDRDTSGCLLISKRRSVLTSLHEQLRGKNHGKKLLGIGWMGNGIQKIKTLPKGC